MYLGAGVAGMDSPVAQRRLLAAISFLCFFAVFLLGYVANELGLNEGR